MTSRMSRKRLWILGAPDPEMEAIEALLREQGEEVAYATSAGKRVHPGNAYKSDFSEWSLMDYSEVTIVECDGDRTPLGSRPVTVIDHHRPGDPGYGRPSAEFLPASSIGQVIALLCRAGILRHTDVSDCNYVTNAAFVRTQVRTKYDWAPGPWEYQWTDAHVVGASAPAGTHDGIRDGFNDTRRTMVSLMFRYRVPETVIMAAAADHCPADAYQGRCPSVDPDALMRWRVESKAQFQKRSADEILADVERAREIVRRAKRLEAVTADGRPTARGLGATNAPGNIANLLRPDPRWLVRGVIPELPEAALREGQSYITTFLERGRKKVVLQCASPEEVEWFLSAFPAQEKYGVPMRGFAGGYIA